MTGHLDIDDVVPLSSKKSSHCLRRKGFNTLFGSKYLHYFIFAQELLELAI